MEPLEDMAEAFAPTVPVPAMHRRRCRCPDRSAGGGTTRTHTHGVSGPRAVDSHQPPHAPHQGRLGSFEQQMNSAEGL